MAPSNPAHNVMCYGIYSTGIWYILHRYGGHRGDVSGGIPGIAYSPCGRYGVPRIREGENPNKEINPAPFCLFAVAQAGGVLKRDWI